MDTHDGGEDCERRLVRFPWQAKPEQRAYADKVVAYILSEISEKYRDVDATAAARAAALFIARCFAAAIPRGGDFAPLLTPDIMYRIGHGFVTSGESVFVFDTRNGQPTLNQATSYDISGATADPNSWEYDCELAVPDGFVRRRVSGAQVLHARLPGSQPWRGDSPLAGLLTAAMLGGIEAQLRGEAVAKSGYLLPFPGASDHDPDDDDDPISALAQGIGDADGATILAEIPTERLQGAATASAAPDYRISRFGLNPPAATLELRRDAAASIYAAVGIRQALLDGQGDATALRESARILYAATLRPWGLLLAADAARLFEHDVSLDWHALNFHDGRTRAQIVTALKSADLATLDESEIMRLAGWTD